MDPEWYENQSGFEPLVDAEHLLTGDSIVSQVFTSIVQVNAELTWVLSGPISPAERWASEQYTLNLLSSECLRSRLK